jgi:putative copper export protein
MTALLRFVHLLALGLWVGSVVFFSFVVAPALFGALPRDLAGRAVSAIFPRYYAFGGACGLVAILSGLLIGARQVSWGRLLVVETVLLVVMTGLVAYSGCVVLPRAAHARALLAGPEGAPGFAEAETRFASLHRLSVLLNGAVLLLGLAAFALAAVQPAPR